MSVCCLLPEHFIYFVSEFKLIESKELQPLADLIQTLMGKDGAKVTDGAASSGVASPAGGEE